MEGIRNQRRMRNILSGWQEIAAYLRVEKTTAQRWEKSAGLPVRRLPGKKGGVFAYSDDLDAWRDGEQGRAQNESAEDRVEAAAGAGDTVGVAESTEQPAGESIEQGSRAVTLRIPLWVLWTSAAVVVIAGVAAVWRWAAPGVPAGVLVHGRLLIAVDQDDRPLWRYQMANAGHPLEDLQDYLWIGELGDEQDALLFREHPMDNRFGHALLAFSRRGHLLWRFRPGRVVQDQRTSYDDSYTITRFRPIPPSGRADRVAVSSVHWWSYPAQVAVLDAKGRLQSQYWNSGHIWALEPVDLAGNGRWQLLAGGANNGYEQAVLLLLDPDHMAGASAVPAGNTHQLQGFGPGVERCVICFPRSCVSKEAEFNIVDGITVKAQRIEVSVTEGINQGPRILYQFDMHLRVTGVTLSSEYAGVHREMEAQGMLDHAYDPKEAQELAARVRVVWK